MGVGSRHSVSQKTLLYCIHPFSWWREVTTCSWWDESGEWYSIWLSLTFDLLSTQLAVGNGQVESKIADWGQAVEGRGGTVFFKHQQLLICWLKEAFLSVYLFFKERERMHTQEEQREREMENWSRTCVLTTEPNKGLQLTIHEIMTSVKFGRLANWATQVPLQV